MKKVSILTLASIAVLSACSSKNGSNNKPEIAGKLNNLPAGTTFTSSGNTNLVKNSDGKWQYKYNAPGGEELLFTVDDFKKDGDFDVSEFKEYTTGPDKNKARFKIARNNLTYGNYGLLEEIVTDSGDTKRNYTAVSFGQTSKELTAFTAPTAKLTFTGTTHAVLTKLGTDEHKNLIGTANLDINAGSSEGNFKFSYKGWNEVTLDYNFATQTASNFNVSGGMIADPIFGAGHNEFKTKIFKDGDNQEVIGTYKLNMNDVYNGYVLNGGFGVKKQ